MIIRRASPLDADEIAAVLHEAFAEFAPLYTLAGFLATTPNATDISLRFGEGPIWVAESDGDVVGTVSLVPRDAELYIRSMAVRPIAQGKGVGTLLLQTVEAFAIQSGCHRLVLSTTPFLLRAIELYEHYGFRQTADKSDLHGTPLLTMLKELPTR